MADRHYEFQIPAGKAYLSPITDCFDGMFISWPIGTQSDAGLVNTMLDPAIGTVTYDEERPIIHFDRGAHYRWPAWLTRVSEANLVCSCRESAVRKTTPLAKASLTG